MVSPTPSPSPSAPSSADSAPMPIVGIGASAGGIDALRQFFHAMPAENGMAFVVVLHLAPDRESNLADILAKETDMTVEAATEDCPVRSNHVYVIPAGRRLTIDDGALHLADTASRHDVAAIDGFFRSLAVDQGDNAVGVVLSGSGTDGTLGLRTLKEEGGITMIQDPDEAEYDSMPRSALSSGLVDLVLPTAELARKLVDYRDSAGVVQLPDRIEALDGEGKSTLQRIFTRLYTATDHDFSNYKRSMILRRLERRMQLRSIRDLDAYLDLLRQDDSEVTALYKDLLISVTSFFRDPEAFRVLADTVVPDLFSNTDVGDQVRVWVPGCATGEEAYSLAMLLIEYTDPLDHAPDVQIFATDVDEEALQVGREGLYPEAIRADVPDDQLDHFFEHEGNYYRVKGRLRERVLFAKHNLLTDPPFSNLDLVSCRNLLIYLNQEMQEHIFSLFHYALNEGGYLFLGRSEASGRANRYFSTLDKASNLLQVRGLPNKKRESLPFTGHLAGGDIDVKKFGGTARQPHGTDGDAEQAMGAPNEAREPEGLHQRALLGEVASVLVNANHEIVHLSDRAGEYLTFEGGTPTHDLLACVPEALRPELRSALYQAFQKGQSVERMDVPMPAEEQTRRLSLFVDPVGDGADGPTYALVRFEECGPRESVDEASDEADTTRGAELRSELDRTREQLQTVNEEYEAATEEMEAANEELLSMNEELQSKNEELETSKEELQSMNEELKTTNQELKAKVEEVRETNSVLENLMAATDIATLFLNRNRQIDRFTPRTTDLFNIRQTDIGRPLSDFTQRFEYKGLIDDVQTVLEDLTVIEREIHHSDNRWFLLRIRPYRTVEDTIEGVVLTFVDITERRKLERELVDATEKARRQIGQDLHDVLSSDLAAAAMKADNLQTRLAEKDVEEAEPLSEIVGTIRTSAEQARTLSHALVPVSRQEEHLAAALETLCREQEELSSFTCTFEGDREEPLPISKETAMHLYRIAHEAVANARIHADASQVRVALRREQDQFVMTIQDDGVGLPENAEKGLGLRSMEYRANLIGASLSIGSVEADGTVVQCTLPLTTARDI